PTVRLRLRASVFACAAPHGNANQGGTLSVSAPRRESGVLRTLLRRPANLRRVSRGRQLDAVGALPLVQRRRRSALGQRLRSRRVHIWSTTRRCARSDVDGRVDRGGGGGRLRILDRSSL